MNQDREDVLLNLTRIFGTSLPHFVSNQSYSWLQSLYRVAAAGMVELKEEKLVFSPMDSTTTLQHVEDLNILYQTQR